jgi:O-antigen ligase
LPAEVSVGQYVDRASSTVNTKDENSAYRLRYWQVALAASGAIGHGFGPYPPEFAIAVGRTPGDSAEPHNSFVAIAYRLGLVAAVSFFLFAALLLSKRVAQARSARLDPQDRAAAAFLAFLTIVAFFNVGLEVPYIGIPFWIVLGFVIGAEARKSPPSSC